MHLDEAVLGATTQPWPTTSSTPAPARARPPRATPGHERSRIRAGRPAACPDGLHRRRSTRTHLPYLWTRRLRAAARRPESLAPRRLHAPAGRPRPTGRPWLTEPRLRGVRRFAPGRFLREPARDGEYDDATLVVAGRSWRRVPGARPDGPMPRRSAARRRTSRCSSSCPGPIVERNAAPATRTCPRQRHRRLADPPRRGGRPRRHDRALRRPVAPPRPVGRGRSPFTRPTGIGPVASRSTLGPAEVLLEMTDPDHPLHLRRYSCSTGSTKTDQPAHQSATAASTSPGPERVRPGPRSVLRRGLVATAGRTPRGRRAPTLAGR